MRGLGGLRVAAVAAALVLASLSCIVWAEGRLKRHRSEAKPFLPAKRVTQSQSVNVTNITSCSDCTYEAPGEGPWQLTAMLSVRVYPDDRMRLTSAELLQWAQYMRWAGVEKLVVCDSHVRPAESQRTALLPLIRQGWVEWLNWTAFNPYDYVRTQMHCYFTAWKLLAPRSQWIIHLDIDEYPVWTPSCARGFLRDALTELQQQHDGRIGTVMLKNYGMLGNPDETQELLLDRFRARTINEINDISPLRKPINFVAGTARIEMHAPTQKPGYKQLVDERLYTLHFWGARLWGFERDKLPADMVPGTPGSKMQVSSELECASRTLLGCKAACPRDKFHWIDR